MPSDPSPNPTRPSGDKQRRRPSPGVGGNWIWLIILVVLGSMFLANPLSNPRRIEYSEFLTLLEGNYLQKVTLIGDRLEAEVNKDKLKDLPKELKDKVPNNGRFSVLRLGG